VTHRWHKPFDTAYSVHGIPREPRHTLVIRRRSRQQHVIQLVDTVGYCSLRVTVGYCTVDSLVLRADGNERLDGRWGAALHDGATAVVVCLLVCLIVVVVVVYSQKLAALREADGVEAVGQVGVVGDRLGYGRYSNPGITVPCRSWRSRRSCWRGRTSRGPEVVVVCLFVCLLLFTHGHGGLAERNGVDVHARVLGLDVVDDDAHRVFGTARIAYWHGRGTVGFMVCYSIPMPCQMTTGVYAATVASRERATTSLILRRYWLRESRTIGNTNMTKWLPDKEKLFADKAWW